MSKHRIHPLIEQREIALSVGVHDALSAKLACLSCACPSNSG